jgi:hypothetical protein
VGARSREERVEQLMVVVVVVATSELLGSSRATYGYRVGGMGASRGRGRKRQLTKSRAYGYRGEA